MKGYNDPLELATITKGEYELSALVDNEYLQVKTVRDNSR